MRYLQRSPSTRRLSRLALSPREKLLAHIGLPLSSAILDLALTHRSFAYENGGVPTNERLEFLGDSVLGIIVTEELYHRFPDFPEGRLAKLRAATVNMRALAEVGRFLGLGEALMVGKGEEVTGGREKNSMLADSVEALIGAIYVDQGFEKTATFVRRIMAPTIEAAENLGAGLDWKTSLQELAAQLGRGLPEYSVEESGPDHLKHFVATCTIGKSSLGTGEGKSKKEAEQRAAAAAFAALEETK